MLCGETRSVDVVFQVQPGSTVTYGLEVPSGDSDSGDVDYSGSIEATVVFDDQTLVAQSIDMSSASRIYESDLDLSVTTQADLEQGNGLETIIISLSRANIESLYRTLGTGAAPVNPDGTLTPAEHRVFYIGGTETTAITPSVSDPVIEVKDFGAPNGFEFENLPGTTSLSISLDGSDPSGQSFILTLVFELDESEVDENGGTKTRVGTITSIASATFSSDPYLAWLADQGLASGDADASNAGGIAYRLLYAFDLDADANALPIAIAGQSNSALVTITLPAGGLNAALSAEYRATLDSGTWGALPAANFVNGSDSLDAGMTGTVQLSFPAGTTGYIRLVAANQASN